MNVQLLGQRFNTFDIVEKTDEDMNNPVENSDLIADEVPVEAGVFYEMPLGTTAAAFTPLTAPLPAEMPIYATPVQAIPMDATPAVVVPLKETIIYKAPIMSQTIAPAAPIVTATGSLATLLNREESEHFRTHWNEIQGEFVDEPRTAVQHADALVSEVIEQITRMFASEHSTLESQWNQGSEVNTEDLRKALQRYRSFFNRLVV